MDIARRAEAERLLGIAEKLLQNKDFTGSRDFAILAQETEPLLEGSDQILAVADVLLAAEKRISNTHLDWYGILQVDRRCDDLELIKRQYRRLALLLHPDKNQFAWADSAFRLVAEAWAVLSNAAKKSALDGELGFFTRVELVATNNNQQRAFGFQQFHRPEDYPAPPQQQQVARQMAAPSPAARSSSGGFEARGNNFWTACPYCYNLYEYPRVYLDCCLRCQNCERAFHAAKIETLPPAVPGKDAYYCYWGYFPVGFSPGEVKESPTPIPNSVNQLPMANGGEGFMPVSFPAGTANAVVHATQVIPSSNANANPKPKPIPKPGARKRGRPRKNPLP